MFVNPWNIGWILITGSSSRPFQIPNTWRVIITCFRLSKAGSAVHPVFVTTVNGESFVIPKIPHASFRNVSAAWKGEGKNRQNRNQILYDMKMKWRKTMALSDVVLASAIRLGPQRPRYGEFSKPTGIYMSVPINNWISFSNLSTNLEKCLRA